MTALTPYLSLAIYPAACLAGWMLNPIEFLWYFNLARQGQPKQPMPEKLCERAAAANRFLSFLTDALIFGLIALLSHEISLSAVRMGLHWENWKHNALVGLIAGALLVAVERLMLRLAPDDPCHPFTSAVRKGSALIWVSIFVTGAFSEELWVAVSLVILKTTGHSTAASVAMTVVVFAAMHYRYRIGGMAAVALKGTVSALLFLHYRSLVVTVLTHFIANVVSLYWNRYWRR